MAAAAPAMCPAPRQTADSARSWSGSVTTTKSQCCRLDADGARQAASAMRSRSAAGRPSTAEGWKAAPDPVRARVGLEVVVGLQIQPVLDGEEVQQAALGLLHQ